MKRIVIALITVLTILAAGALPASAYSEDASLTAADAAALDRFGLAVATDGDTIVVGVPDDNDKTGSAYVFTFDGAAWNGQKLTAADGAPGDEFGFSVAVSGGTIAIGSPDDDDNGASSGSVYVFSFDGAAWNEQKLTAADGTAGSQLGYSVAVGGGTIVAGAPYDDEMGADAGAVYLFTFDGVAWNEEKLLAGDGESGDNLGFSVSAGDGFIVGGAYGDDDSGAAAGAAYVFAFDGVEWSGTKLVASDGATYDRFGRSVSASGDTIVVGAPYDDDSGSSSGSAYVFAYDGVEWNETKLTAEDAAAADYFGYSVSASDDRVVIGAYNDDDNGAESGSAYVFTFDGAAWDQTKLTATDGAAGDNMGWAVATGGDTIVAGAPYNDQAGENAGAVYVYQAPTSGAPEPGSIDITAEVVIPGGIDANDIDGVFSVLVTGPSFPSGTEITFVVENGAIVGENPQSLGELLPGSYTIEELGSAEEWTMEIVSSPVEVASVATVTVVFSYLTVEETISELAEDIAELDLPQGVSGGLNSKLDTVAKVLADNNQKNDVSAVNSLEAFINQVEAQLGKKIPVEEGLLLIEKAREIIDRLSG